MINKILKLYFNDSGSLYVSSKKNRIFFLTKLSNLYYTLEVYLPFAPDSVTVQGFFRKPNNETPPGLPMASNSKSEVIDGVTYYGYSLIITDDIISVASPTRENKLGVSFYITNGSVENTINLNTEVYNIPCTYAITGEQIEIDETELQYIQRIYDEALSKKLSIYDGINVVEEIGEVNTDSDTGNLGFVYLLTQDDGDFKKGDIVIINKETQQKELLVKYLTDDLLALQQYVSNLERTLKNQINDLGISKVTRYFNKGIYASEGDYDKILQYSSEENPEHIVQRDSTGEIIVKETPTNEKAATSKKYVDKKIQDLIGFAPESLDTLKELADAYLSIGIKSAVSDITKALTEEEILALWETLEDGRYTLLSTDYGNELVFVNKVNNEYSRMLPSGKVIAYDFEEEEWVQVSGGGGGGGGDSTIITITPISPITFTSSLLSKTIIEFSWISESYGNGMLYTYVNGVLVNTKAVSQGTVSNDITSFVNQAGDYAVKFIVEDAYGNKRTIIYNVSIVELTIYSDFDDSEFFKSVISYDYQAYGDLEKTMHFILDGVETTKIVLTSGSKDTYYIDNLTHGVHDFEVYSTAIINGVEVESNKYTYKIIFYEEGNPTPLIASKFNTTNIKQGDNLIVDYIVYTNTTIYTPEVKHIINGVETTYTNIDRTKQAWRIANYEVGNNVIQVIASNTVGEATYSNSIQFEVNVEKTDMKIEAETANLELFLSSNGKSNIDSDRDQWSYNNIATTFTNFNWNTNGWLLDKNNITALTLNGDARAVINYKPFSRDIKSEGITIEIEFSTANVLNYDTEIINIVNNNIGISVKPTEFIFKSLQQTITQGFKEDEHIRMAITIQKQSSNRFIQTYINGVLSGIKVYNSDDSFDQLTASSITIGSNYCDTNIYKIRIYKAELEADIVLNNYIADTELLTEKQKIYNRNQILDSYGNVYYNYVRNIMPVFIITCDELPDAKDIIKYGSISFENKLNNNALDFSYSNVSFKVQGTSSLQYYVKNLDIQLPDDIGAAIQLYPNAIKEKKITLKVDYASSAGVYNAGNAKIVNNIYEEPNPAQEEDSRVRNAIYGIPVAVFYRKSASDNLTFHCKGSLNTSKLANALGYQEGDESWSTENNTSPLCKFDSVDFTTISTDFDPRYLVEPEEPTEDYDKYANLKELITWVYSCKGNPEKFKAEVENYFNLYYLKMYYIYFMVMGGIDSMAKNMYLTYFAKDGKWYPQFYDMDSAFGIDNTGRLSFNYDIEPMDKVGEDYAFNGSESVLWTLVRDAYDVNTLLVEEGDVIEDKDTISYMYRDLRSKGLISYEAMMEVLYNDGIELYPERIYNKDAKIKYIDVYLNIGKNYLSSALGSTLDHLKFWIANRINYLDSKWLGEDYLTDRISCRITTPESVTPDYSLTLKSYRDMYLEIQYGGYYAIERAVRNTTYLLEPELPEGTKFNDTETYIFGASSITEIGDLSKWYLSLFESGNLVKLSRLVLGSQDPTYSNENLTVLTLSTPQSPNNYMLRYLDISNCTGLTSSLDLSKLFALETFYGKGTNLQAVSFSNGGQLKIVHLPNTINTLTLQNQSAITDFQCETTNLVNIRVENSNINTLSLVQDNIDTLNRVRLIGVNWTISDLTLLDKLLEKQGYTDSGANYDKSVLAGKIIITSTVYSDQVEAYRSYWGTSLTIEATGGIITRYVCKFYNDDILLETKYVYPNENVTYTGTLPTKEYTGEGNYAYRFIGWDKPQTNITANTNFYAQYELVPYYQVIFQDYQGNVLQESLVPSGSLASYNGETPTKPTDYDLQEKYTFSNWSPDITLPITTNTVFTPQFSISKFWKVRWLNWDNSILMSAYYVDDGNYTSYKGTTPTRENDDNYSYTFSSWSPNPSTTPITQNTDFIAQFVGSRLITVTWLNGDGSTLLTQKVGTGQSVTYTGATPTKPNDAQYKDYVFTNWLGSDGNTYENIILSVPYQLTLTPQFIGTLQVYNVYWISEGTILETDQVPYGGTAEYNGSTPMHSQGYTFSGWGTDDFVITGDTSFYAVFDEPTIFNISVLQDNVTPSVTVKAISDTYPLVINWGDGTSDTYNLTKGVETTCTKSVAYANTGDYVVTMPASEEFEFSGNSDMIRILMGSDYQGRDVRITSASIKKTDLSNANYAFLYQILLTDISLPDNLKTLPQKMFWLCTGLETIDIPDSVTYIQSEVFKGCSSLKNVKLPANLQSGGSTIFENCSSLENLVIPDKLVILGWRFCSNCENLKTVTIGRGVQSVGSKVFDGSDNLEVVRLLSPTPPSIQETSFPTSVKEYRVPANSVEAYKTATNWSTNADKIVADV